MDSGLDNAGKGFNTDKGCFQVLYVYSRVSKSLGHLRESIKASDGFGAVGRLSSV